jgi:hypothetical protein
MNKFLKNLAFNLKDPEIGSLETGTLVFIFPE